MRHNHTSTHLLTVAIVIGLLSVLSLVRGFAMDGWTFQAFDTGPSPAFDTFCTLCPCSLILASASLSLAMKRY